MVEQAADEYVSIAQKLLDIHHKDWSDEDWKEWQKIIETNRRLKSETINQLRPRQEDMIAAIQQYFSVKISSENRDKITTDPFTADPNNFTITTRKHSTIIEPAVKDILRSVVESQKLLHRIFPILRLHQKGISGLIDRLTELDNLNEKLEEENNSLKLQLDEINSKKKTELDEKVEPVEEAELVDKPLPKKKKGRPKKQEIQEEEDKVPFDDVMEEEEPDPSKFG